METNIALWFIYVFLVINAFEPEWGIWSNFTLVLTLYSQQYAYLKHKLLFSCARLIYILYKLIM